MKEGTARSVTLKTRKTIPAYVLRGYRLRWTAYGRSDIPLERHEAILPDLEPGRELKLPLGLPGKDVLRLRVDLVRPTGFSAATALG